MLIKQWQHVSSKNNPADVVSRGVSPVDIKDCNIWFHGPLFLHGPKNSWPQVQLRGVSDKSALECKKQTTVLITSLKDNLVNMIYKIDHHGSVMHLNRVVGYVLRSISNARLGKDKRTTTMFFTASELDNAMIIILKSIQQSEFDDDIKHLKTYQHLKPTNSLASLTPFLDSQGLIRVGGRIQNSELPFDARHPVLLPYNYPIAKLTMTRLHESNFHCGPQALLAQTRQKYWPIKSRLWQSPWCNIAYAALARGQNYSIRLWEISHKIVLQSTDDC